METEEYLDGVFRLVLATVVLAKDGPIADKTMGDIRPLIPLLKAVFAQAYAMGRASNRK